MATIRVHARHHLHICTRLFARMVAIDKLKTLIKIEERQQKRLNRIVSDSLIQELSTDDTEETDRRT